MAITNLVPNGNVVAAESEQFYADYNGTTMNTVNNRISWTDSGYTTGDTYLIRYSKNGGSTWTNIGATLSSDGTDNDRYYDWSLTYTEYQDIFGSAYQNESMRVEVTNNTTSDTVTSANSFMFNTCPFINILPSSSTALAPYYNAHLLNISWSFAYDSAITTGTIQYTTNGGVSWSTIKSSANLTRGGYVWETPLTSGITSTSKVAFRIVGEGVHANMLAYSEGDDSANTGITITDNLTLLAKASSETWRFPSRLDTYTRVAIEKSNFLDEAVCAAQLERGYGIAINQRDHKGHINGYNKYGTTAPDYASAYNFVFSVTDTARKAREIHGIINFLDGDNPGIIPVASQTAGDNYYGSTYYIDIALETDGTPWRLGDPTNDDYYIAGQTPNSYRLHYQEVLEEGGLASPTCNHLRYEAVDMNTVRIYCTVRGTAVLPDSGVTADSLVTLDKDKIGTSVGTYLFEYTIREALA